MMPFGGKVAAVIGTGGMGLRHMEAYRRLGVRVGAVCDVREQALEKARGQWPGVRTYRSVEELIGGGADRVDIVSVVANTPSRAAILRALLDSGAKRVLTEKPLATNLSDAHAVVEAYEERGKPLTVNTFRHFCDNHLRMRQLLRSGRLGSPRYCAIQCASAGLGNMGSVFLDVMNFYLESRPVEVSGCVDRTGTPSVRGSQFRDPGGFGAVYYENGARGFLDTSEDTGVPYTFHLVATYGRVFIDELFDRWSVAARGQADREARPLTYYLAPLEEVPFPLAHRYDPVEMTSFAMAAALRDEQGARNARQALTVMEMIMAFHLSDRMGRVPVRLPIGPEHRGLDIPFA